MAMVRDVLVDLPDMELPDGYSVRTYLPGDGSAWERIIGESFKKEMDPGSFNSIMRDDSAFRPERIFLVIYDSVPAFIIYWRERNELRQDWDSKFMNRVVSEWSSNKTINDNISTRDMTIDDELNDTSWAI